MYIRTLERVQRREVASCAGAERSQSSGKLWNIALPSLDPDSVQPGRWFHARRIRCDHGGDRMLLLEADQLRARVLIAPRWGVEGHEVEI